MPPVGAAIEEDTRDQVSVNEGALKISGEVAAPGERGVPDLRSSLVYAAAVLSFAAASVHLWLMPEHLARSLGYGALFAALALAQGFFGVALLRWPARRSVTAPMAWGSLAVISAYAAERLVWASHAGAGLGAHGGRHASGLEVLAILFSAAQAGLLFAVLLLGAGKLLPAAEALSFGVAFVHLWEAQERYGDWWGFGLFFLGVGLAQGFYCLALPRFAGRASFLLAGMAGNLSVVAVWVLTRTYGIPYVRTHAVESPELRLGKNEGVGVADLAATSMEVALVLMLALLAMAASNLYRGETTPGQEPAHALVEEKEMGR
jgi:hypothetical protein